MQTLLSRIATLLIVAATGAGCGGGNGPVEPDTPVLTTLEVTPATATLFTVAPGNTAALSVVAKDQDGQAMSGLGSPTFSSDNGAVATVSDAGAVTAGSSRNGDDHGISDRRRRNRDGHHYGHHSSCAGDRSGDRTGARIPAGNSGRAGGRHGDLDIYIPSTQRHLHQWRSAG